MCKPKSLKIDAVPGAVSNLMGARSSTSVVLTWSAPQEPNGVIISYEVTYRVNGTLFTANTTNLTFTITSLTPGSSVTDISVSAYTSMGRGKSTKLSLLSTPCKFDDMQL